MLRGEGRAFCAGRDISGVDPRDDDVLGYLGGLVQPLLERMAAFPAPTFAVAHGACLGVGLGLLIASDIVYVADTAKIGSPFANLGATLDSGGHALFVERLGAHRTMDLIVTGRLMSGAEAVASGLFSQVFPADEVTDATRAAARAAASGATQAFVASKALVASLRDERLGLWAVDGRGEPRPGRALRHRRLPRGLRRLPAEAQAGVHRARLSHGHPPRLLRRVLPTPLASSRAQRPRQGSVQAHDRGGASPGGVLGPRMAVLRYFGTSVLRYRLLGAEVSSSAE